jgi:Cu2+-exporting ATPase
MTATCRNGVRRSCCAPGAELALAKADPHTANEEVLLASRIIVDDVSQTHLSVPGIHCGGCIQKVEAALGALPCDRTTRIARTGKTPMC